MYKSGMLGLVLLIPAFWLQAQSANSASDAGQSAGKTSGLTTLTGCLKSAEYQYTLTEDDGTVHRLAGAANKLGHHVGHEIEVTGKPGTRSEDVTLPGGSSGVIERQVFEVKSVKDIASTCNSGG